MRILMITRKVDRDDDRAGFVYTWVKKMGEAIEAQDGQSAGMSHSRLYVVCLESGNILELPDTVMVFGVNKKNKLVKLFKYFVALLRLVPKVDGIFCHMNPEYTITVAPIAKIFRKKVISWYTHGAVSFRMRLMEKFADVVLTASKESFRLPSKKLLVLGHGIDVERFKSESHEVRKSESKLCLLTVGRISPTKDVESMIQAVGILKQQGITHISLKIVGAAGLASQQEYFNALKEMVKTLDLHKEIEFVGPVPNRIVASYYQKAQVFINMSGTGSLDKSVLEAMACECLVLTSNEAFKEIFDKDFLVQRDNPKDLAQKIEALKKLSPKEREKIGRGFRDYVVTNHNLDLLVKKILDNFSR